MGSTLRWVAREFPQLPCLSCEFNKTVYALAKVRTGEKNARIFHADSVRFLEENLHDHRSALFWLDAHWGENWPILDELRVIIRSGVKGVVLIDDFDIQREGFGFDSYRS